MTETEWLFGNLTTKLSVSSQSIPNNAETVITFDNLNWDTGGFCSSIPTNRIIMPTDSAGYYLVGAFCSWGTPTVSFYFRVIIKRNSVTLFAAHQTTTANQLSSITCSNVHALNDGDILELYVFQNSGAAKNTGTISFYLAKIGDTYE